MTRSRVSGAIWTAVVAPVRTRETVLWETPVARATSRIVTTPVRRPDPVDHQPFTAPDMKPRT